MKKMSVFMILMLMVTVLLAGCKNEEGTGTEATTEKGTTEKVTEKEEAKKDVTITIFQSKVEITEQLEKLAKEYTELTGVNVEVWGTTGDGYVTQLQTKLASGQGPTILSAGPGGTETETLGDYLLDLSDQEFVQYIAPNMAVQYDGKIVGVPYGVEGFGLVYNASMIQPSEVTNLDTFKSAMDKLASEGIQPFSLSSESYFLIGHILNVPFALQEDPQAFIAGLNDGTKKMADDPIFQDWAAFMEVIRDKGTNALEVKYDVQSGDFASGKTAIIHQGNWSYGMFKDYNVSFDMGMMPLPVNGNDKISVGIPNSWAINNQASEDEIAAALELFNWLFTSDKGKDYIVKDFGFIPAMTNIQTDSLDPLGKSVADFTASGKTLPWMFSYWPSGIVDSDFLPATQGFFLDKKMTAEQYLQYLDEAWANASSKQ